MLLSCMCPRKHVLDGYRSHMRKANFEGWGKGRLTEKYRDLHGPSIVICAKTAESIEMPFGIWTRLDPVKDACVR